MASTIGGLGHEHAVGVVVVVLFDVAVGVGHLTDVALVVLDIVVHASVGKVAVGGVDTLQRVLAERQRPERRVGARPG